MKYKEYHFQELAGDPWFRKWILEGDKAAKRFWTNWVVDNPEEEKKVLTAKTFLLALREKDTDLSDAELERITLNVIAQGELPLKNDMVTSDTESAMNRPLEKDTSLSDAELERITLNVISRREQSSKNDTPPGDAELVINRPSKKAWLAASVALVLLTGLGYYLYFSKSEVAPQVTSINEMILDDFREISNPTASVKVVELADGSTISLYPKSKVKFPEDFNKNERSVYLTGQAFFEVVKNAQKPFWVFTENISTQVVGTSFMVKAFEGAKESNVEVKKGKVLVYTRKDLKTAQKGQTNTLPGMMISSNQKVSFSRTEEKLVKSIIKEPEQIEEMDGSLFRLEEERVAVVFARIEKVYGIPINYDTQSMAECYVTANLEGEALFRKLDLICKITHSSYEIADGQIFVYSKGCY